jgi:hypothetical protein
MIVRDPRPALQGIMHHELDELSIGHRLEPATRLAVAQVWLPFPFVIVERIILPEGRSSADLRGGAASFFRCVGHKTAHPEGCAVYAPYTIRRGPTRLGRRA